MSDSQPDQRPVSGTYRGSSAADADRIIEIRVDIDGHRPQRKVSGDIHVRSTFLGVEEINYVESFAVSGLEIGGDAEEMTIRGPVSGRTGGSMLIFLPRVPLGSSQPAISVNWFSDGGPTTVFGCRKISEFFRTATLEVDRFRGTIFPADLDPAIDPSPAGLPGPVSVRSAFADAGIDLGVELDDMLTDPDSPDPDTTWSALELHDLMEARFDSFSNDPHWKLYGVVVPLIDNVPGFSAIFGVMFDWGLAQPEDTAFRQGFAVAAEALRGHESGALYDTSAKKERLFLRTLIHEAGHAWNLPHTWDRSVPTYASNSFMNYPQRYTGGAGGEVAYWSDFRWTFDDVEIAWMRHADRDDVIFGGTDFTVGSLSHVPAKAAVRLTGPALVEAAEPVYVTLTFTNDTSGPIELPRDLSPEAGTVRIQIRRPGGDMVDYRPPVRLMVAPGDTITVAPGESHAGSFPLSIPAFPVAGAYQISAALTPAPNTVLPSNTLRLRVRHPADLAEEELTAVVTRPDVAQFLYFGGSARHPGLADELTEVAFRHEQTSPATTRHLYAALGRHNARQAKYLEVRDGRRVVAVRTPDLDAAVRNLQRATAPSTRGVFDDLTLARLTNDLVDAYTRTGRVDEARQAADAALGRLTSSTAKEQLTAPPR